VIYSSHMTDAIADAGAKKKVLIAEDEELLLGILSSQFAEKGYDVVTARDGREGVDKFFSERPDAVVVDVIMPRMDGIEMLAEIAKRAPEDATPLIVLSNSSDMRHIADAMANKAIDYLIKSNQHLDDIVSTVERRIATRAK
jgi:DNA-binding NtrC family response regulator